MGFRGSGKSTILAQSFPIWAVVGKQQLKHVLILTQTILHAKQHMKDIRDVLVRNDLLKQDMGPFKEEDEWQSFSIVIPRYGAKITCMSREQNVRGIKYGPYRPQLIILDDTEDLSSMSSKETCDKVFAWFMGDVMPLGDQRTRILLLGNMLGRESLLARVARMIQDGSLTGTFRKYPFLDESGRCLWPGMFPQEKLEKFKHSFNETTWEREFLLHDVSNEEQLVLREQIHYYDKLPPLAGNDKFRFSATGIDLAISQSTTADFTSMVSAHVFFGDEDEQIIYIAPNSVNARLSFAETIETAKKLSYSLGNGDMTQLYIEDVAYQAAAVQEMVRQDLPAEGVKIHGSDKRARLAVISHLIQNGKILFPRHGAERLIEQIVHLGTERYDDLVDAFTILVSQIMNRRPQLLGAMWLDEDEDGNVEVKDHTFWA